jgi:NAD(P)-dependent dehydrogenase (short-subunit alcohol dehydrogenase family)
MPALPHVTAKGGLVAMTRQLAAEGAAHGVRVNTVSPGFVATPQSLTEFGPEVEQMVLRGLLIKRVGRPEDVAKCTVFVRDKGIRPVIDKYWTELFPDATSRPARHTLRAELADSLQIQLEIVAVLGEG